ncbi:nuclear transport factor 2 family protein [Mycolicibacter algericus]|uniref:nuclear transport factor 2 family protein n=1 Tax=Mycolicibacter algericus TaxID=1288388 RepID=UPI0013D137F8
MGRYRAANSARRTHHQCTNIRLRRDDDDGASGTVMLVLHVSDGGDSPYVDFIGEYHDRYARDQHGIWRFNTRVLHPLAATRAP